MIKMIWAQDMNRGIGKNGDLPWHLPEDLKHFKVTTGASPVIMGRKSYEALPDKFRPLPNRTNYVITHDLSSETAQRIQQEGAIPLTLEDAKALLSDASDDIFIIGGGSIYTEFMSYADELIITQIDHEFDCDTFAPAIPASFALSNETEWQTSINGLKWKVCVFRC